MLKELLNRLHSPDEDLKNFIINVVANVMSNRR